MTRRLLALAALAALVLALPAALRADVRRAHPCHARLPHGPALPAPIVMRTACGSFHVATDGRVSRLPRHWLVRHSGGTGRRFEATLNVHRNRAGRYFLLDHGRLLWRSHALYPNDGGSIGFGPGEFAFASYCRGVYLTDLRGAERLVVRGRGLYPYDFTDAGDLIVVASRTIVIVSRQGRTLRRFHFRARNGLAFDARSDTLFFVTRRGRLAVVRGMQLRLARRIRIDGALSAQNGLLVFGGAHSITVSRRDGSVVARAAWESRSLGADSGVSVEPGGRAFAFRLSDARPGARSATATIYLLRRGASRATPLYRHHLGPSGCAVGANLSWHGRFLLYSSTDGHQAVVDTATGGVTDLSGLATLLPRLSVAEHASPAWTSDLGA